LVGLDGRLTADAAMIIGCKLRQREVAVVGTVVDIRCHRGGRPSGAVDRLMLGRLLPEGRPGDRRFLVGLSGLRRSHHGQRKPGGRNHGDRRLAPRSCSVRSFRLGGDVPLHVQHLILLVVRGAGPCSCREVDLRQRPRMRLAGVTIYSRAPKFRSRAEDRKN